MRDFPERKTRLPDEMTTKLQIPLENIEYAVEQYLLLHGCRIDTETRYLLAAVRDTIARTAVSARRLAADARLLCDTQEEAPTPRWRVA
jgi:hypothetical protein